MYIPPPIRGCAHRDIDTQTYMHIACGYGREKETASSHSPLLPASLQTLSGSLCRQWGWVGGCACVRASLCVVCEHLPVLDAGE